MLGDDIELLIRYIIHHNLTPQYLTLMHRAQIISRHNSSISGQLLPWLFVSPGDQLPWYWLHMIYRSIRIKISTTCTISSWVHIFFFITTPDTQYQAWLAGDADFISLDLMMLFYLIIRASLSCKKHSYFLYTLWCNWGWVRHICVGNLTIIAV